MPSRCHPDFEPLLTSHFSRPDLDQAPASVIGLWPDATLAYLNEAWDDFAALNGGQPEISHSWDLGASYFEPIAAPLLPFYRDLLGRTPEPGASLRPVSHEYECSSASVFRKFSMHVYALAGRAGFVIVNSLLVEHPYDAAGASPLPANGAHYVDEAGIIHQCCHCRRVQSAAEADRWDWVTDWVETIPPNTSHTICPICLEYYYPLGGRRGGRGSTPSA